MILGGRKPQVDLDKVTLLAEHCSDREQRAAEAERELKKIKLLGYMQKRIGSQLDAVVTGVEDFGLFVQGVDLPAEGLLPLEGLGDDYYQFDSESYSLAGHRKGNQFRLGDRLRVEVVRVDIDRRELDFRLVKRFGEAPDAPRRQRREEFSEQGADNGSFPARSRAGQAFFGVIRRQTQRASEERQTQGTSVVWYFGRSGRRAHGSWKCILYNFAFALGVSPDFAQICHGLNADPAVMEHFPAPLSQAESNALAERIQAAMEERGWGLWAVEILGGEPFIGFVGLSIPRFEAHFTPCVEIGWRLARSAFGGGVMPQRRRRLRLEFGFCNLGLGEIVSFTSAQNDRSRRTDGAASNDA